MEILMLEAGDTACGDREPLSDIGKMMLFARSHLAPQPCEPQCSPPDNPGSHGPRWTAQELALLGTASDAEIAERTGKSRDAVRAQRVRRKIVANK
jgi:hypothetical protein